jgi:hypothetical protein
VLLPVARIAVEFVGGVHRLTPEHARRRRCYPETTLGLMVVELHDSHLRDKLAARGYLRERLEALALLSCRAGGTALGPAHGTGQRHSHTRR